MIEPSNRTNMYDEIEYQARRKVRKKRSFFIVATVFAFVSSILIAISLAVPAGGFWVLFPVFIFALILGMIYLIMFGIPYTGTYSKEWEEEEIDHEMMRIYYQRRKYLPPAEELSEDDRLELKELERLREKWEYREDYE